MASLAGVLALAGVVGLASSSYAAEKVAGMGWGRHAQSRDANTVKPDNAKFEAQRANQEAKRTAAAAAIAANDYTAWVTAEGADSPMVKLITVDKFPKFVEAKNLMTQAQNIMKELGLEKGPGFGPGMMRGQGQLAAPVVN